MALAAGGRVKNGQLMVIENFNGEDVLDVFITGEEEGQRNRLTLSQLIPGSAPSRHCARSRR